MERTATEAFTALFSARELLDSKISNGESLTLVIEPELPSMNIPSVGLVSEKEDSEPPAYVARVPEGMFHAIRNS